MPTWLIALGLLALAVAVQAATVWKLGRRPGGTRLRPWQAIAIVGVGFVGAIVLWALTHPLLPGDDDLIGGPQIFFAALWLMGLGAFVHVRWRGLGRAVGRWALYGLVLAVEYAVFAFVVEEEVIQTCRPLGTSIMSPTIQGFHSEQACPSCGGPFYVKWFGRMGPDGTAVVDERFRKPGVCERCLFTDDVPAHVPPFRRPDHYVVNHTLAPERWRVVAFRVPHTTGGFPEVGRLVGLPGETVFLRDEAVWVNGQKLEVPAHLPRFRYTERLRPSTLELMDKKRARCFGHPDEPLTLAADEFFILLDDPDSALDSRIHGPHKEIDYLGTVDTIFWPPRRWRRVP